ncbi:Glutamate receptor ionotropic, kainate 5 [Collichthys lucidus]|uniref:Glutamate receptor ionotropic, kainate 5 n=1 Tax=Collichthys lucidus TaxID=240159 RepID=A0A4U5VLM2_COLLU|nr:Glutamate receptor ionotropic, kainate 5 [Collichthys lucidus]
MSVVKQVMLLLLAAISTNAALGPEDCDGLNVTLPANQLHEIYGGWVLVWTVADNQPLSSLISNLSSSKIELRLLPDNNTITYHEWNLFQDKSCTRYSLNMSLVSGSENFTLNYMAGRESIDALMKIHFRIFGFSVSADEQLCDDMTSSPQVTTPTNDVTQDFPLLRLDDVVDDQSNIVGFSMLNQSHPFYLEFLRSLNLSWMEGCDISPYPGPAVRAGHNQTQQQLMNLSEVQCLCFLVAAQVLDLSHRAEPLYFKSVFMSVQLKTPPDNDIKK